MSKKLKVLEAFGGIGAATQALKNIGVDYEVKDYIEIDKYAVKSYNAINGCNYEAQDISEWDKDIDVDLMIHGSPCQSFSIAGLQAGGDKGSGTPSSLMYESIRIIEKLKPKYVVWENVKNLLGKKHIHNYEAYLNTLDEFGYNNYYQVLNARDFEIPQNRQRIFTISIRKDIDDLSFAFPEPKELKLRLKDVLEAKVDEKYYLSDRAISGLIKHNENHERKGTGFIWKPKNADKEIANCLRANAAFCPTDNSIIEANRLYGIFDTEESKHQAGSVYDKNGLSPTLDTAQGGWRQPCIEERVTGLIKNQGTEITRLTDVSNTLLARDYKGFGNQEMNCVIEKTVEDKVIIDDMYKNREPRVYEDVSPTLRSERYGLKTIDGLRIRRLTPRECWRLMGFSKLVDGVWIDEAFEKAQAVNSNTQLYKQAGNSIVVSVLEAIFKNLLKD